MTEYRYLGIDRGRIDAHPRRGEAPEPNPPLRINIAVGKNDRIASVDLSDEEAYRLVRTLVDALAVRAGHRVFG